MNLISYEIEKNSRLSAPYYPAGHEFEEDYFDNEALVGFFEFDYEHIWSVNILSSALRASDPIKFHRYCAKDGHQWFVLDSRAGAAEKTKRLPLHERFMHICVLRREVPALPRAHYRNHQAPQEKQQGSNFRSTASEEKAISFLEFSPSDQAHNRVAVMDDSRDNNKLVHSQPKRIASPHRLISPRAYSPPNNLISPKARGRSPPPTIPNHAIASIASPPRALSPPARAFSPPNPSTSPPAHSSLWDRAMSPKKSQQKDQISPPMKVQPVSQSGTGSVPDAVFLDYDRTLQLLQETLATRGTGRVHEMLRILVYPPYIASRC